MTAKKATKPVTKKKGWQGSGPGRKRLGAKHVMLTFAKDFAQEVDVWIANQPDRPSWPEAIRRLARLGLSKRKQTVR
jgi:hypothetical protein